MSATRKYQFNESYFEKIDSQEKAYWLGFIAADGYITKRKQGQNVFGLTLHEKEPLEKLSVNMESNKPIYEYDNRKYKQKFSDKTEYKLLFVSNKLVSDLEKNGIIERKTFKLEFPYFLNKDFYSHFIRGYFDGDGSVFFSKKKKESLDDILCVSICGTYKMLSSIKEQLGFLNEDSKCLYKDDRVETDCWNLKLYNQSRALAFYEYIYKDSNNILLQRKKDKFDNYIDTKVQRLQSAILEYERIKV